MTAEECLIKIMEDAHNLDTEKLDLLNKVKKDAEIAKVVRRWLKWISSVNVPEYDTGCTYIDQEEE